MGEATKIQWCHYTFNPWWGCAKVSPACKHCYAEAWAKRTGHKVWGVGGARRFFEAKHWREPLKWARAAAKAGERRRVFCASMADVFEDHPALEPERQKLWDLIRQTAVIGIHGKPLVQGDGGIDYSDVVTRRPGLDWLLLTKRPENIVRMAPADFLPLVWAGTTVEDQEHAELRIPELLKVPARVRFLSCEPLLGPVELDAPRGRALGLIWNRCAECAGTASVPVEGGGAPCSACLDHQGLSASIDWVIVGGESGPGARPFDLAWARSIRDQCAAAGLPVFVKQLGAAPFEDGAGRHCQFEVELKDQKGGDMDEWPEDLRVRQFPEVRHA